MADPCWKGYTQVGMKKKNGKEVPNCVPSKGVPKAKGYKKVEEQVEMTRYCPKCQKDETRSQCKYGPKYWDMFSIPSALTANQLKYDIAQVHPANESKEPDHEHSMARSEISTIISAAKKLRNKLKGEGNIEAWVQSKITKAADYIDSAADYLDSGEHKVHGSMDESVSNEPKLKPGSGLGGGKPVYPPGIQPKPTGSKLFPIKSASKSKRNLQVSSYEPCTKTFSEFMQEAIDKSKMKCNDPKAQAHGTGEQGKSHVVKACEDGKEKIIRFGQVGVKGSPKKEGESKEYANRRKRFKARHAKNIDKGKMSAAYWSDRVKW